MIIPVVITVYEDRSFDFVTKTPPAAVLLKKAAGVEHGSGEPNTKKVAKVTKDQVKEIAKQRCKTLTLPMLKRLCAWLKEQLVPWASKSKAKTHCSDSQ